MLRNPPESPSPSQAGVLTVLSEAFQAHRIHLADSPIGFDQAVAKVSASLLHRACWFLVDLSEQMMRRLFLDKVQPNASEHLSADVVFRFLPQIRHRTMATAPDDRLETIVSEVLRLWPLSGVPKGRPDDISARGGHPGLWLLFAERLFAHRRNFWMTPPGPIRDRVDWLGQG